MLTQCDMRTWLSCYNSDGAIAMDDVLSEVRSGIQIPIENSNRSVCNRIWYVIRRMYADFSLL